MPHPRKQTGTSVPQLIPLVRPKCEIQPFNVVMQICLYDVEQRAYLTSLAKLAESNLTLHEHDHEVMTPGPLNI